MSVDGLVRRRAASARGRDCAIGVAIATSQTQAHRRFHSRVSPRGPTLFREHSSIRGLLSHVSTGGDLPHCSPRPPHETKGCPLIVGAARRAPSSTPPTRRRRHRHSRCGLAGAPPLRVRVLTTMARTTLTLDTSARWRRAAHQRQLQRGFTSSPRLRARRFHERRWSGSSA